MENGHGELRPVSVRVGPEKEGFFHGWCREPFFNDAGEYVTKTYALIETASGLVKMVEPSMIKFKKPHRAVGADAT